MPTLSVVADTICCLSANWRYWQRQYGKKVQWRRLPVWVRRSVVCRHHLLQMQCVDKFAFVKHPPRRHTRRCIQHKII